MVPQPGTKHNAQHRREHPASVLARGVSFVLLAGLALAIIAALVLLPAYARLNQIIVERDRIAAANADDEARIVAQDRLIEAIPKDRTLAKRLSMKHFGALPRTEYVVAATEDLRAPQAGSVTIDPTPRPRPVANRLTATAAKIARPTTRLLLMTMALATLVAAIVLTAAPRCKRRAPPPREVRRQDRTT